MFATTLVRPEKEIILGAFSEDQKQEWMKDYLAEHGIKTYPKTMKAFSASPFLIVILFMLSSVFKNERDCLSLFFFICTLASIVATSILGFWVDANWKAQVRAQEAFDIAVTQEIHGCTKEYLKKRTAYRKQFLEELQVHCKKHNQQFFLLGDLDSSCLIVEIRYIGENGYTFVYSQEV